LKHITV